MKEILTELEAIAAHHYDRLQVFDDWLQIMLAACMKQTDAYLTVLNKYERVPNGTQIHEHFTNAFALYLERLRKTRLELISELYQAWMPQARDSYRLRAPTYIAPLLVSLIHLRGGSIYDPACGSGKLFSECLRLMSREQKQGCTFYGHESELRFVQMCALTLALCNAHGYVIWGEARNMTIQRVYAIERGEKAAVVKILTDEELVAFRKRYEVIVQTVELFTKGRKLGQVNYSYN